MVDPITIIGTAGAIANIIDVATKTINALRDLYDRWKDADFTLLNLIAQITALKAALSKIQQWLDSENERLQHHQLTMDLDASITCCRMLITRMNSAIQELNRGAAGGLDLGSKIKVVLGERKHEEFQKLIDRQISVLALVFSVCSW